MFYWVLKATLGPVLAVLWQPRAYGVENVPRHGPAILVGNHLSFSDHFFGPLPLPRKITFLAKAEYFTGKGIKGFLSRLFFTGVGQIPIDRSGGKASEAALRTGLRVLEQGKLLGIYPEAPAPQTAGCTGGAPGWPGSRWKQKSRSSRWR